MDLYLSNHANVRNTNFCIADGQVVYKSETPGSVFAPNKKTTVYKVVPNDTPEDMSTSSHFFCIQGEIHNVINRGQIYRSSDYRLANIDIFEIDIQRCRHADGLQRGLRAVRVFDSSLLTTWRSLTRYPTSTRHRVFTAPGDGRSFKWTLGMWTVTVNFSSLPHSRNY